MNYRGRPFTDLPQGHYAAAVIDPPWKYLTWSKKGMGRSPDRHYDTMTLEEIMAIPLKTVLKPRAIVFVWVIDTHVEMALELLKAWGLKYKTVGFYWAKTNKDGSMFMGTGHWTRANPEHVMEAVLDDEPDDGTCRYCGDTGWFYGDKDLGPCGCEASYRLDEQEVERCFLSTTNRPPSRQDAAVRRLIVSPRREHSRKPDETLERVERLVEGPYLEMFSRADRDGWDSWGDQAGMFGGDLPFRDPVGDSVLDLYMQALEG